MIRRQINIQLVTELFQGKALLVFGPRQVGKTTALLSLLDDYKDQVLFLNADEEDVKVSLEKTTTTALKLIFGDKKIIFIDEAQRVSGIGITLKLITDNIKDVQVIVTGSSAFDLSSKTQESLTGRKLEYFMYPLSFQEMVDHHGFLEEKRSLEQRLIYGYYPEIVTNPLKAQRNIKSLADSYLYKDLLQLENIKKPALLMKILKALALQIGSEVSFQEVGRLVGADTHTVEKYVDLLEKAFVVFTLPALNRNVRNEIKKGKKIYFYDTGMRNAVISNFGPVESRNDKGMLWENFMIAERMKYLTYNEIDTDKYFWRTTQQQEIDYLEERQGIFQAYEFKWSTSKSSRFSKTFMNAYQTEKTMIITPENMHEFIYT